MSGDTNLGQGSFGGATIRPSDGAALSPPHPVTGVRRTTQTKSTRGTSTQWLNLVDQQRLL